MNSPHHINLQVSVNDLWLLIEVRGYSPLWEAFSCIVLPCIWWIHRTCMRWSQKSVMFLTWFCFEILLNFLPWVSLMTYYDLEYKTNKSFPFLIAFIRLSYHSNRKQLGYRERLAWQMEWLNVQWWECKTILPLNKTVG